MNFFNDGFVTNNSQPTNRDRSKITLYFIGGGFVKMLNKDGVLTAPLALKGQKMINLPPIGEGFVVDSVVAKDIRDRLHVWTDKAGWVDGVTENPQIAQAVKKAFFESETKDLDYTDLTRIVQVSAIQQLDTKDLEAELERRKKEDAATARKNSRKGANEPVVEEKGE